MMFIYREEYYDKDSERPGEADIIIAKHRNGPVGEVVLTFQNEYPKFMNYAGERFASRHERALPVRHCATARGFVLDEATNTAYDCRCRAARIVHGQGPQPVGGDPAALPRRRRSTAAGDRDRSARSSRATRRFAGDDRRASSTPAAACGSWARSGTGKTTLAMLVSKAALEAGRSVAIYSLPRLLNEIRDTHRAERSHVDLLDRLTAVDLLHIDDVGAERTTDWVLEELYSIVNARYEDERSMVITTNILDREALCEQITERTVSRLTEMCDELPLGGDDQRSVAAFACRTRPGLRGSA